MNELRTSEEKAARAKALAVKQRHYDMLHHRMRVALLKPVSHENRALIRDSERILAGEFCTRSVDLNDSEYLAELDAFESETKERAA